MFDIDGEIDCGFGFNIYEVRTTDATKKPGDLVKIGFKAGQDKKTIECAHARRINLKVFSAIELTQEEIVALKLEYVHMLPVFVYQNTNTNKRYIAGLQIGGRRKSLQYEI